MVNATHFNTFYHNKIMNNNNNENFEDSIVYKLTVYFHFQFHVGSKSTCIATTYEPLHVISNNVAF